MFSIFLIMDSILNSNVCNYKLSRTLEYMENIWNLGNPKGEQNIIRGMSNGFNR